MLLHSKETIIIIKRQLLLGKILENHRSDKELTSKTCEDLKHPSRRKYQRS